MEVVREAGKARARMKLAGCWSPRKQGKNLRESFIQRRVLRSMRAGSCRWGCQRACTVSPPSRTPSPSTRCSGGSGAAWVTWTRELSWTSASRSGGWHLDLSQVRQVDQVAPERSAAGAGTGLEVEEMNSVDALRAKARREELHSRPAMLLSLGTAWTMCQTLLRICPD